LPTVLVPTHNGVKTITVASGQTLLSVFKKHKAVGRAARSGLERLDTSTGKWIPVDLSFVVRDQDRIRPKVAAQGLAGNALGQILKTIFSASKRRKRDLRDNRRR
jgi:hypothetical protein